MSGIFSITESVDAQMQRFHSLRSDGTDADGPSRCKHMFELGEELVNCASNGQLSRFQRLAYSEGKENMLIYFTVKMMQAALIGGHLLLAGFIIDNGFPINKIIAGLPSCMHEVLKVADDDRCCAVMEFLIAKHFDINLQENKSWETALHISIRFEY
jgi:hypothetical protein